MTHFFSLDYRTMMDMFGAYSVGSFEMRLLTYNVHVSPAEHDAIDETCLQCFTANSSNWLNIEHGFHSCSVLHDGSVHVSFLLRTLSCFSFLNLFSG